MYDKYFSATPLTLGSTKLPKHKGILFSGGTAGGPSATLHLLNTSGNTISASITVNSSPYFFPMEVYAVPTLSTGLTAFYVN